MAEDIKDDRLEIRDLDGQMGIWDTKENDWARSSIGGKAFTRDTIVSANSLKDNILRHLRRKGSFLSPIDLARRQAKLEGYIQAMKDFAVWNSGHQYIGAGRLLSEEITEVLREGIPERG